MEIKYQQSASERQAALAHLQEQARGHSLRQGFWRALVAGILIGLLLLMKGGAYAGWLWVLVTLALAAQGAWILGWAGDGRHAAGREPDGGYVANFVAAGISRCLPDGHVEFYAWPEVAALEAAGGYLYFHLGRGGALVVPRAEAAAGAPDAPSLEEEVRRLWAAHPANAGKVLPGLPSVPESPLYQALVDLGAAVRLVCFFKFDPLSFRASWGALAVLVLIDAVQEALLEYYSAAMPLLDWTGVGLYGVSLLLFLGWGLAVNRLMAQRASLLQLLVMALSASLVVEAIYLLLTWGIALLPRAPEALAQGVYVAYVLLMVAAMARIVRRLYAKGVFAALFLGGALVLFQTTLGELFPDDGIYVNAADVQGTHADRQHRESVREKGRGATRPAPQAAPQEDGGNPVDDDDDDDDDDGNDLPPPSANLDVEDIYYRQPGLIRHQLEVLKPRQPGETGLYFVGFAGDASEHEFGNEVRYARGLLDRRFNTAGRSLLLINSYDTVKDTPLANTHNMEAVLQGLAGRMDRDNDVLFVFLSSHGAQDHRLGVSFYPLEMNDLKAEKLKEMLDQCGIRNRVIVVSACYSGGFLDVLKDDNTLVLTASRRDHVAYGCGDITEYTYFGDAYFVKALEHNDSFIDAFDEARKRIAEREKSEGMDASGPQIYVGRNIEKVLHRLKIVPAGLKQVKASSAGDGLPAGSRP